MKNTIYCFLFLILVSLSQAQPQTQSQPVAPPTTDIYLFPLDHGRINPLGIRNITQRKGYDNQPNFLSDSNKLFYTSIGEDEQADIFLYDISNATAQNVTNSAESEYSPTLTPEGNFFSTIRVEKDGTQRLWKFPLSGGDPVLILEQVKPVGYHAWIDSDSLALFILGKPPTLQIADLQSGTSSIVASNIGRSLHKIPRKTGISFVQKLTEQRGTIKEYDPESKQTSDLIALFPGVEDHAWTPDGTLITADGSKIYFLKPGKDEDWKLEIDLYGEKLDKITRIAVSPNGEWIAVVAEERDLE